MIMDWEEVIGFLFLTLLVGAGVAIAYWFARFITMSYRKGNNSTTSAAAQLYSYVISIVAVGFMAVVIGSFYYGGGCEECPEGGIPTVPVRKKNAFYAKTFFLLLLPSLIGVYRGFKAKPEDFPPDESNLWDELQKEEKERKEAAGKVDAFSAFLAGSRLLIKDARRLPYPKGQTMRALNLLEQYLCDIINLGSVAGDEETLAEHRQFLEHIRSARVRLAQFSDIAPEDIKAVDYFNSYANSRDIPSEEYAEYIALEGRYREKGIAETLANERDVLRMTQSNK